MTIRKSTLILAGALLLTAPPLPAQTQLNFKRVINNWPTIELYFMVSCNGQRNFSLDKSKFRVEENGVEIKDFELWCPDPVARCPASLSLVLDAGAGMAGKADSAAKEGALYFVQKMESNGDKLDEASMTLSGDSVLVRQSMTAKYDALRKALDSLPSSGRSRILDGIYAGISEIVANGVNQCRAVIVFTNGLDTASTHTLQETISYANRNRIRVFMIGVGDSIASGWQKSLADLTGGRYYGRPKGVQFLQIYQEITTTTWDWPVYDCLITYMTHGMNGSIRTVNLTVSDSCGTDTKTKTYKALRDTSTYIPLKFRLAAGQVVDGNSLVSVPLRLENTFYAGTFQPVTFTVHYDDQCAGFAGFTVPQGSPWDGVPISIARVPGGIEVKTTTGKALAADQGPTTLAELLFRTSDPDGHDTVCCWLRLARWSFDVEDYYKPILLDGEICILPRWADVLCSLQAPQALAWDASRTAYTPNPFTVALQLFNNGTREARGVRCAIRVGERDAALVSPLVHEQSLGEPVQPQGSASAQWALRAKPRAHGDSIPVSFTAYFDNQDSIACTAKIWIPAAPGATTAETMDALPSGPRLAAAFPNPFVTVTSISYALPAAMPLRLAVFDALGREVALLRDGIAGAGEHAAAFDARGLPPGVYVAVLLAGGTMRARMLSLVR